MTEERWKSIMDPSARILKEPTKDRCFGSRLRQIRLEKMISERELADLAGIHRNLISKYEIGQIDPSLFTAVCLADALDVSLDWLTWRTDER